MTIFAYQWIHVPSGKVGTTEQAAPSSAAFVRRMRRWNANQPGVWVYRLIGVRRPGLA